MPGHGGLVGEDLCAVLALDLHGDLVVHRQDVRVERAPRGQVLAAPLALVVVRRHQALLAQVGRLVAGKQGLIYWQTIQLRGPFTTGTKS